MKTTLKSEDAQPRQQSEYLEVQAKNKRELKAANAEIRLCAHPPRPGGSLHTRPTPGYGVREEGALDPPPILGATRSAAPSPSDYYFVVSQIHVFWQFTCSPNA